MANQKTIDLSSPLPGHGELIRKVVLKEPTYADYMSLGDPFVIARNSDGSLFPVENGDVIRAYIDRCCVSPDPLLLAGLSLADAMAVKGAVLSFFTEAQATPSTPVTSSSST
jgi:hypothetical protein